MPEIVKTKLEQSSEYVNKFLTNKRNRSAFLLIISFVFILGINSVLPVIQGQSKFTAGAVEVPYSQYVVMHESNENYNLSWTSLQSIALYKTQYALSHPELPIEEALLVEVPDIFKVQVYTKFFFQDLFWYVSTITSLGSAVIMYYALFNYLITSAKERDAKYVKLLKQIDDVADNFLDPVTFEPWMDQVFNRRRKIDQHKSNVKYQLDRLERITPYKVKRKLREYFKNRSPEVLLKLGKLSFLEKKYLNSREKYIALLEENYINEFVVDGRVAHFKYIYPMFVYNGENGHGRTVDNYSLMKTDAQKIGESAANKVTMSLITTLLFAVLFTMTAVSSYEQEPIWIAINAISKIAPLMIQIPNAFDYSYVFMNNQLINNLISRRSIELLYLAYMKVPVPKELKEGEPDATKN